MGVGSGGPWETTALALGATADEADPSTRATTRCVGGLLFGGGGVGRAAVESAFCKDCQPRGGIHLIGAVLNASAVAVAAATKGPTRLVAHRSRPQ